MGINGLEEDRLALGSAPELHILTTLIFTFITIVHTEKINNSYTPCVSD
jgi:hypothetical protein